MKRPETFSRRKGVSPLIAGVMLIAFTVAIGSIAAPWFTDMMESSQRGSSDQADQILEGLKTQISITAVEYNSSSGNYTVTVENTGDRDITGFSATIYGEEYYTVDVNENLSLMEKHTFTIETDPSKSKEKLTVETYDVPAKATKNLEDLG